MIKFNIDENRKVGIRRDNTENTVCANLVAARDYSVTELKKYICYPFGDFELINPDVYIDICANGNGVVFCVDDAETKYILILPPSVEEDIIKKAKKFIKEDTDLTVRRFCTFANLKIVGNKLYRGSQIVGYGNRSAYPYTFYIKPDIDFELFLIKNQIAFPVKISPEEKILHEINRKSCDPARYYAFNPDMVFDDMDEDEKEKGYCRFSKLWKKNGKRNSII